MKIKITLLFIMLLSVTLLLAQGTPSALQIIENVYRRAAPEDQQAELQMTLINSRGEERTRQIQQYLKAYSDMDKKIMFFKFPADVRNTTFMNWSYDDESKDDDQWIYLPALQKVKRISSDSKSDYFMGSDFTYDDLGERHPGEDTHRIIAEEMINGEECYVVESIPVDEDYMYSRTVTWIIKGKWIGLKKEFYDEDEELLKILTVKEYQNISSYWIVLNTEMHNVQKDHLTRIKLSKLQIDRGISDTQFTERMMRRGL
ncbi:MAG: outer membrane lipoprotein-sorting protein [Candidatus Marinimicrobia bacterium]|nr:outer membrane lipoprotein-sorting protein [Candidatus Neomarinimicrobiota bacterium]